MDAVEFMQEVVSVLNLGYEGKGILEANLAELRRWKSELAAARSYKPPSAGERTPMSLGFADFMVAEERKRSDALQVRICNLEHENASLQKTIAEERKRTADEHALREFAETQHALQVRRADDLRALLNSEREKAKTADDGARRLLFDACRDASDKAEREGDNCAKVSLRYLAEELRK